MLRTRCRACRLRPFGLGSQVGLLQNPEEIHCVQQAADHNHRHERPIVRLDAAQDQVPLGKESARGWMPTMERAATTNAAEVQGILRAVPANVEMPTVPVRKRIAPAMKKRVALVMA